MRIFVWLLGLLSLLGMQTHAFATHHHHGLNDPTHSHEAIHQYSHEYDVDHSQQCELTSDQHNHWHCHTSDIGVKLTRSNRDISDFVGILPTPVVVEILSEQSAPLRVSHPFIPFQTGPPGNVSSRGPPVA